MTIHYIPVAGEIKDAFETANPGQTIDAAFVRWLNDQSLTRPKPSKEEVEAFMEGMQRIRESGPSVSEDEIRKLRHEGRP
jgi:hypothetical protein